MRSFIKKMSPGRMIVVVAIYAVLVVFLALFFMNRSRRISDELLENQMIDIARCAAQSVDGDTLKAINSADESTSEFQEVYKALSLFLKNTEAKYIYAIKAWPDHRYSFILDTDPRDPGQFGEAIEKTPALDDASKGLPSVDTDPYEDRWGSFYSAYCAVYDSDGNMAGIIAVDYPSDWYEDQVSSQSRRILFICLSAIAISAIIVFLILWEARRETGIKRRERDEMEIAQVEAWQANKSKSRFLHNMSREIRLPIDTVLNQDELLLRESVEPDIREYAMNIRHAGNELLSLMDEVLDISQIESEDSELRPVRYNPYMLISDLTEIVQARIRGKELKLITEIDDMLPSILFGDAARIKQCLVNLVTNSVRFTEEGEIHVSLKRVRIHDNSVWLRFEVHDTGGGIEQDELTLLINALEDINEVKHTAIEATATSLCIVNRVLRTLGSRLEIASKPKQGSTFFFTLEQKMIDEKPVANFIRAQEVMNIDEEVTDLLPYVAPDAKVLIVDDAKMHLKLMRKMLADIEVQIDTSESGEEALEMMAKKDYDLLIFDHLMPDIDGVELLRLVRENHESANHNKPCIVLTGNTIAGAKDEYLKVGFDAYLSKPVRKRRLESVMRHYLPSDLIKNNGF